MSNLPLFWKYIGIDKAGNSNTYKKRIDYELEKKVAAAVEKLGDREFVEGSELRKWGIVNCCCDQCSYGCFFFFFFFSSEVAWRRRIKWVPSYSCSKTQRRKQKRLNFEKWVWSGSQSLNPKWLFRIYIRKKKN